MLNFRQRLNRPQKNHPRSQLFGEAILLAAVWLLLVVMFLLAGYKDSPKLQRYQLELASYTDGVTKPKLLSQTCGDDIVSTLYTHRNDSHFTPLTACPPLGSSGLNRTALEHLNQLQSALATTWQTQQRNQRQTDLVANETETYLASDRLGSRKDWLHLDDQGQLDSLTQLMRLSPDKLDSASYTLSLLAVADGNRKFPYNRLFANQPAVAKLFNQAANEVASIYDANNNQAKAKQANDLLPLVGSPKQLGMLSQVMIWSWVAFGLLALSRRYHPLQTVGFALVAWGLVLAGVSHGVILPMMVGVTVFCIGVLFSVLMIFAPMRRWMAAHPDNRQLLSSVLIYPLFVGFVTFGLMVLFDLSTRSYLSLRYIFLNHFKDVFWCFVFISLARPVSSLVSLALKNWVANNLLHSGFGNVKSAVTHARIWLVAFAVGYLGLAVLIHSDSAKVAELAKIWLMVFLGVFLAINQRGLINQLFFRSKKMTLLLAFAVVIPFIALAIANEKGTMLVMLFVFTFLVGVALSNKIFQMGGRGYILGVLSSTAILLMLMMVLVNLSGFDDRTAERVNAWVNPFVATNDQMAILHWFRESVPLLGYGFGDIPWCGYRLAGCQGVPLQMQSDYTITSVMAVTGMGASVVLMAVYFGWLSLIASRQMAYASEQIKSRVLSGGYFLLAWVILLWVVLTVFQALVTISGNLGILPLTGVTLPFLSYGTSNLWLNTIMLSLALFQPKLMLGENQ